MASTYLDAILDRLPPNRREDFVRLVHRFGIPDDSADLVGPYLQTEALAALLSSVEAERERIEGTARDLPETMRAAAVPIIAGLADEMREAVVVGVREDLRGEFILSCRNVVEMCEALIADTKRISDALAVEAKSVSTAAKAEVTATSNAMSQASQGLAVAAIRLCGWTSSRVATVAIGVALAAGMFVAGTITHAADVVFGCPSRVERAASALRLSAHNTNIIRNYICRS